MHGCTTTPLPRRGRGVLILLAFSESRVAPWMLVAYLAWIRYATALNAEIVRLN